MHISIKWKLIGFGVLLVSLSVLTLGRLSYMTAKKEIYSSVERKLQEQAIMIKNQIELAMELTQEKVNSDLNVAHHSLYLYGSPTLDHEERMEIQAVNQITQSTRTLTIPTMRIQDKQVANNFEIVDTIQQMVGGTATIFQVIPDGILRISTNVLKRDGARAVGTYIPSDSPVYQTIMRGDTFYGRAFVVNAWYQTAYEPIKDGRGEIIGVLYVGVKDASKAILDKLSEFVVGKTGYLWVLSANERSQGEYVLSFKRQRDGENIFQAQDAGGRYFIQEWIENALSLQSEEVIIDYYSWKNKGEKSARIKISAYTYLSEWQWLIGSGAYIDDFQDSLKKIKFLIALVSIGAILVGIIIAYVIARLIIKPLLKSVEFAKSLAQGEFDAQINVRQRDETGILAHALTDMRDRIYDVLQETNTLIIAVQEGNLHTRGHAQAFAGDWSQLVVSINSLIEAFVQPINVTAASIERISNGDIPEQIVGEYRGDFCQIRDNLNRLVRTLRDILNEITSGTHVLLDSGQELTVSSQEISNTSNQQAAAVKEVVSTMEDSDRLAKSIAAKVQEVTEMTETTKNIVNNGFSTVQAGLAKMEEIKQANTETITGIESLGSQIASIWEIVNMITGIADQTKIIAFNAELEAASAGDAGKNFQIVASEIRRLADSTVASTNEIKTKINHIQQASDKLMIASEEDTVKITEGWDLSKKLHTLFEHILNSANVTDQAADQIALSINQQVSTFEQILQTLKQISEGIEHFVVSTKATSEASAKLKDTADGLYAVMKNFVGKAD